MTGLFYNIMFRVGCPKVCSAWNKLVAKIMNLIWPIYCKAFPENKGMNQERRETPIIVSMTSFPARFSTLHLCVESIMRQSCRPDMIVLWLVKSECKGIQIPKQLLELEKYGLKIRYTDENLKPHNKLIFSAAEYKNAIIITMDDDILYPSYTIENLVNGYKHHKDCVICNMAHEITLNDEYMPNPYSKWKGGAIGKTGPSHLLIALGVGGVLYPPGIFDKEYFNYATIRKECLTADDIWLKYNEYRQNYKVFKAFANAKNPVTISKTQGVALTDLNNGQSRNDVIVENLNRYFSFNWMQREEE